MRVVLSHVGKRFNRDWIFREFSCELQSGQGYAVLGGNGSGKSTLLQLLAGYGTPSEGQIDFGMERAKAYRQVAMAAPYTELLEEYTLAESIAFHRKLQPLLIDSDTGVMEKLGLAHVPDKELRYYSSGMKQRAKLGLAIVSDCPVLLLDEPTSNLDAKAVAWYNDLLQAYAKDKLVVICSNQGDDEHGFCGTKINIEDYK